MTLSKGHPPIVRWVGAYGKNLGSASADYELVQFQDQFRSAEPLRWVASPCGRGWHSGIFSESGRRAHVGLLLGPGTSIRVAFDRDAWTEVTRRRGRQRWRYTTYGAETFRSLAQLRKWQLGRWIEDSLEGVPEGHGEVLVTRPVYRAILVLGREGRISKSCRSFLERAAEVRPDLPVIQIPGDVPGVGRIAGKSLVISATGEKAQTRRTLRVALDRVSKRVCQELSKTHPEYRWTRSFQGDKSVAVLGKHELRFVVYVEKCYGGFSIRLDVEGPGIGTCWLSLPPGMDLPKIAKEWAEHVGREAERAFRRFTD